MSNLSFWTDDWMKSARQAISDLLGAPYSDIWEAEYNYRKKMAIKRKVRDAFCEATGWRLRKGSWDSLANLTGVGARWHHGAALMRWGSHLDHPECFTRGAGRIFGDRMTIVHNYDYANPVVGSLDGLPFEAVRLPWSWYYPDKCTAWMITATGKLPTK